MFVIDRIMIILVAFIFLTQSSMSGSHVFNVHASQNDGFHKNSHNCESCKRHCYCPPYNMEPYYNCPIEIGCHDLENTKCCFSPETQPIEKSNILAESKSTIPEETIVRYEIEQACKIIVLIWLCVIFLIIVLGINVCIRGHASRRNRWRTGHFSSTRARILVHESIPIAPPYILFNDVVNGPENVQQPLCGTADDDRLPSYEDACRIVVDSGDVAGGHGHTHSAIAASAELAATDEPPPRYEECVRSKYTADVIDLHSTYA